MSPSLASVIGIGKAPFYFPKPSFNHTISCSCTQRLWLDSM
uniref:Uncharacterized protein n=1 Tax=Arundo donax TaxID=35708 RepID=A0A0A9DP60_ARUDO